MMVSLDHKKAATRVPDSCLCILFYKQIVAVLLYADVVYSDFGSIGSGSPLVLPAYSYLTTY